MPVTATVNTNNFSEVGYNIISFVHTPAATHFSYRIYRRPADLRTDWVLIANILTVGGTQVFNDYYSPAGEQLYVVIEVVTTGGIQVEDPKTPTVLVVLGTPYYWLVHPTDTAKNVQLRDVKEETFKDERDVEIKKLIGRGRKVDVGDYYGKVGSISGRVYDRSGKTARAARLDLQDAKATFSHYFLRNPFGDVWKIWWDDPDYSRVAGVGTSEYVDISFAYYEVF